MSPPRRPGQKTTPPGKAAPARQHPASRPAPAATRQAREAPAAVANPAAAASDQALQQLEDLFDSLPAGFEPLDAVMVDGYLCALLLQPARVPVAMWLPWAIDADGRPPPPGFALARFRELLLNRYNALDRAIAGRQWFDPWVYLLDEATSPSDTVMPWVAGFAMAADRFSALMDRHEDRLTEPLALLYRHLDPDDLEDADELLAEIDTLEPPETVDEAVEDLVSAVLLIADVSRPRAPERRPGARAPAGRRGPPRRSGPSRR